MGVFFVVFDFVLSKKVMNILLDFFFIYLLVLVFLFCCDDCLKSYLRSNKSSVFVFYFKQVKNSSRKENKQNIFPNIFFPIVIV